MPPAEILREREDLPTDPGPPPPASPGRPVPPESPGFAELAAATTPQIEAARQSRLESSGRQREAMVQQQEAMRPVFERTQQMLAEPRPTPPPRPELPEAPSRGLHQFLAPVQGEPPENTITKLINGIGLMAGGFTGLARGDARAALAGLTGAMTGWHQGDKERADRGFSDWQAATGRLLKDWELRHQEYRDILENKKTSVEQQMKAFQLKLLETGLTAALEQGIGQDLDRTLGWLGDDRKHYTDLALARDQLEQSKQLKELQFLMSESAREEARRRFEAEFEQRERLAQGDVKLQGPLGFKGASELIHPTTMAAPAPEMTGQQAMAAGYVHADPKAREQLAALNQTDVILGELAQKAKSLITAQNPGEAMSQYVRLRAEAMSGQGTDARAYEHSRSAFLGVIARTMGGERGTLTDRDIQRIEQMLPGFFDTAAVRDAKLTQLATILNTAKESQRRLVLGLPVTTVTTPMATGAAPAGAKTMLIRKKGSDGKWTYAEGPEGPIPGGWERSGGR